MRENAPYGICNFQNFRGYLQTPFFQKGAPPNDPTSSVPIVPILRNDHWASPLFFCYTSLPPHIEQYTAGTKHLRQNRNPRLFLALISELWVVGFSIRRFVTFVCFCAPCINSLTFVKHWTFIINSSSNCLPFITLQLSLKLNSRITLSLLHRCFHSL